MKACRVLCKHRGDVSPGPVLIEHPTWLAYVNQAAIKNTDAQAMRFLTTLARSEPVSVKL